MKNILILGAGLSASTMIKYLLDHSTEYNWKITVGDVSAETAQKKVAGHPNGTAIKFDIKDESLKTEQIKKADVVISFLPAFMHPIVAKTCVELGKHMVTASYVSKEMKALDAEAKQKGVALLNELGVDPGIDHMSAMQVIHKIKAMGGKMIGFMSNTGGLVAPEYDNNPWNYKFTWNPRNVVLAGQSVAQYKEQGQYKFIPYHKLFTRATKFSVLHLGEFEMYPNRDSLSYREIYGLEDIPSILRGTFRRPGYCNAWNVFVQLGATDDSYVMEGSENMTYRDYINSFLAFDQKLSVEEKLCKYTGITPDSDVFKRIKWLGVFENTKVGMKDATPAQILQKILEAKLSLCSEDKDLIVMQHVFDFELNGKKKRIKSSLICTGIDTVHTAMSITVGTPVAIATKMLLTGQINLTGVHVPVIPELYNPILKELEEHGIKFIEEEEEL
ncbi:MAG: saccharopine dehydrogenase [Bacteroidetes bacterium RIFOXYA12_FULL_35_11]|nr:MAG: saccharopine dehydrogenase [Bacteroidetes bacterium GWF2_35_48]OFY82106.1 MAG: saccharopine dehydrogenase [Bacteroidetes bacterium RIFOXYA12_FULL_35_11]HBX53151.1 saccharopine dehydrogenase [Bacteroidales bacterium]